MSDITLVQYDTAPSIYGTLTNITQVDLEAATSLKFQMRLTTSEAFKVNADAVIDDAPSLVVRYDWGPLDLSMPGEYTARWQVTRADGTIQHSEPENTITISTI